MHRRGHTYSDDSESLQADVMRFMAIIAFCLIAILALVKHADPEEKTAAAEPVEPEPASEVVQLAAAIPEPVVPEPESQPIQPDPVFERPLQPDPEPLPEIEPPVVEPIAAAVIEQPEPAPETAVTTEPEPEPPAAAPELPEPTPAAQPEPEEEGLILRFASDGDFLRLIARGDIQVYAFQETDVLTLSESYRFLDTQSPGQVYELLPPSIPNLIVDALRQARPDINGYRWGIALPGHISNQIERHLGQVTSGQLVIDRYGDVHHVAAS